MNDFRDWWSGKPSKEVNPAQQSLNNQIKGELQIWIHLRSVLESRASGSEELAIRDIQQLHLESLVGTDIRIQQYRAKLLPGSQSSSSEFSLAEDMIKDLINKIIASAKKGNKNGVEAAFSLLQEALKIPGFPEERIAELFLPILNSDAIGDKFFEKLVGTPITANKENLILKFIGLLSGKRLSTFKETVGRRGNTPLLAYAGNAEIISAKIVLLLMSKNISKSAFLGEISLGILMGPSKGMDELFEIIDGLDKAEVKKWLFTPVRFSNGMEPFEIYVAHSKDISARHIKKFIDLGAFQGISYFSDLLSNNSLIENGEELLNCLKCFDQQAVREWINKKNRDNHYPLVNYLRAENPDLKTLIFLTPDPISEELKEGIKSRIIIELDSGKVEWVLFRHPEVLLNWLKHIDMPNTKALKILINLCKKNPKLVHDFVNVINERHFFLGSDESSDEELASFLTVYSENYSEINDHLLDSIIMNHKLKFSGETLENILRIQRIVKAQSPSTTQIKNESFLVAVQTCDDVKELENYVSHPPIRHIPQTTEQFLSLSIEDQQWVLTGFILSRDRKGLQLVSELLKNADRGETISKPVLRSALTLLKKTQMFHDPEVDETHLLNLIFTLWASTEAQTHQEVEHVLAEAVMALAELDFVRLKSQYRSGIFEIFKTLAINDQAQPSVLNGFVEALGLYPYDASKIEDREILDFLITLMKKETTATELKFSLAKILSTIKYEPALLSAWDVIKGPLWDRYAQHEEEKDRKVIEGCFDLFNALPLHLHENRGIIKRRILDLLAEINIPKEDFPKLFKEFYERNISKLPSLSKFEHSLKAMPEGGVRYFDPLYLPQGSFVFRGINGRKGDTRAIDGLVDLFERGSGDSELTKAKAASGTWAKVGQIFCALDKKYVQTYVGELGAFIVIKGDYINQAIQKRRVRQQREIGSTHYVLYDTIGHQNIEKIYISKTIYAELQKLKMADPDKIDPSELSIFGHLSKQELGRFIRSLKHDPHHLFEKLEGSDTFYGDLTTTKEPEISFEKVVSYNQEKEGARQMMEEKYASHFAPPAKSRL